MIETEKLLKYNQIRKTKKEFDLERHLICHVKCIWSLKRKVIGRKATIRNRKRTLGYVV